MSSSFPQNALKAASVLVMSFGVIVALAAHPSTGGVASFFGDLLFWPLDSRPSLLSPGSRLLAAIGGGVMFGWGLMLWHVSVHLLPAHPVLAARIVRSSLLAWFIVDSLGSTVAGAPLNAALNAVLLAAFLWPLSKLGRTAPAV